jgi:hypothetical protein
MGTVLGATGMLLLLGAFLANVAGRLRPDGAPYQALNAVGAGLLAWYSLELGVWIFVILEAVWSLAALWNLVNVLRGRPPSGAAH